MKKIIFTYFIILISINISFSQNDCDCWIKKVKEIDKDYNTIVLELEAKLIEKGYLIDSKPESYEKLIDTIISKNEYLLLGIEFNPILVTEFKNYFLLNSCKTKVYKKIRLMNNKLKSYDDLNPAIAFNDFRKIFNEDDFNKIEVKHYFFVFYFIPLLNVDPISPQLFETKPTAIETSKSLAKRNILKVYISAKDSIYVNNNLVKFEDLKEVVKNHISNTSNSKNSPEIEYKKIENLGKRAISNQVISVIIHSLSSFKLYVNVQQELINSYNEVRNDISVKEFGISYDKMLKDREEYNKNIKIIKMLLPIRISEMELIVN